MVGTAQSVFAHPAICWRSLAPPKPSSPANAGDPVFQSISDAAETPRRAGYSAFAEYDGLWERMDRAPKRSCLYSTPIVVRSWNQCCACTNFLILGESACGLVSCTTHTSAASSTISAWACAIRSSCFLISKVCLASLINESTFGFLYPPQFTPTGAT